MTINLTPSNLGIKLDVGQLNDDKNLLYIYEDDLAYYDDDLHWRLRYNAEIDIEQTHIDAIDGVHYNIELGDDELEQIHLFDASALDYSLYVDDSTLLQTHVEGCNNIYYEIDITHPDLLYIHVVHPTIEELTIYFDEAELTYIHNNHNDDINYEIGLIRLNNLVFHDELCTFHDEECHWWRRDFQQIHIIDIDEMVFTHHYSTLYFTDDATILYFYDNGEPALTGTHNLTADELVYEIELPEESIQNNYSLIPDELTYEFDSGVMSYINFNEEPAHYHDEPMHWHKSGFVQIQMLNNDSFDYSFEIGEPEYIYHATPNEIAYNIEFDEVTLLQNYTLNVDDLDYEFRFVASSYIHFNKDPAHYHDEPMYWWKDGFVQYQFIDTDGFDYKIELGEPDYIYVDFPDDLEYETQIDESQITQTHNIDIDELVYEYKLSCESFIHFHDYGCHFINRPLYWYGNCILQFHLLENDGFEYEIDLGEVYYTHVLHPEDLTYEYHLNYPDFIQIQYLNTDLFEYKYYLGSESYIHFHNEGCHFEDDPLYWYVSGILQFHLLENDGFEYEIDLGEVYYVHYVHPNEIIYEVDIPESTISQIHVIDNDEIEYPTHNDESDITQLYNIDNDDLEYEIDLGENYYLHDIGVDGIAYELFIDDVIIQYIHILDNDGIEHPFNISDVTHDGEYQLTPNGIEYEFLLGKMYGIKPDDVEYEIEITHPESLYDFDINDIDYDIEFQLPMYIVSGAQHLFFIEELTFSYYIDPHFVFDINDISYDYIIDADVKLLIHSDDIEYLVNIDEIDLYQEQLIDADDITYSVHYQESEFNEINDLIPDGIEYLIDVDQVAFLSYIATNDLEYEVHIDETVIDQNHPFLLSDLVYEYEMETNVYQVQDLEADSLEHIINIGDVEYSQIILCDDIEHEIIIDENEITHQLHNNIIDELDYYVYLPRESNNFATEHNVFSIVSNFCIALNTEIQLLDGSTRSLQSLIDEYNSTGTLDYWTYTVLPSGNIGAGHITAASITRFNQPIVGVNLDNGSTIFTTSDHLFITDTLTTLRADAVSTGTILKSAFTATPVTVTSVTTGHTPRDVGTLILSHIIDIDQTHNIGIDGIAYNVNFTRVVYGVAQPGGPGAAILLIPNVLRYNYHLEFTDNIEQIYQTRENISAIVQNRVPEFVKDDYKAFHRFVDDFFIWLEDNRQFSNTLLDWNQDREVTLQNSPYIDKLIEQMGFYFRPEIAITKSMLVHFLREFYLTRGSKKSFYILFKMLFNNENVRINYPRDFLLIPSAANYGTEYFIFSRLPSNADDELDYMVENVKDFSGTVKGLISNTETHIEDIQIITGTTQRYMQIQIFKPIGDFRVGEPVEIIVGAEKVFTTLVNVADFEINDAGNNYKPNDFIIVDSNNIRGISIVESIKGGSIEAVHYVSGNINDSTLFNELVLARRRSETDGEGFVGRIISIDGINFSHIEVLSGGYKYTELPELYIQNHPHTNVLLRASGSNIGGVNTIKTVSPTIDFNINDAYNVFSSNGGGMNANVYEKTIFARERYYNRIGILGERSDLTDSHIKQQFSYEIVSNQSPSTYREIVDDLLHPTGYVQSRVVEIDNIITSTKRKSGGLVAKEIELSSYVLSVNSVGYEIIIESPTLQETSNTPDDLLFGITINRPNLREDGNLGEPSEIIIPHYMNEPLTEGIDVYQTIPLGLMFNFLIDGNIDMDEFILPIGEPIAGGFFAGVIDTTRNNIQPNDVYQDGKRYMLIMSPGTHESSHSRAWDTVGGVTESGCLTRWDGLSATNFIIAKSHSRYQAFNHLNNLRASNPAPYYPNASDWYIPAMDEMELLYRYFKPHIYSNSKRVVTRCNFPSDEFDSHEESGRNISSLDATNNPYSEFIPDQTPLVNFHEKEDDSLKGVRYWTSTDADSDDSIGWTRAWTMGVRSSFSGRGRLNVTDKSSNTWSIIRPVRRILLD